jgi:hypothetical protein
MIWRKIVVSGGLAAVALTLIALAPAPSTAADERGAEIARGEYLVAIGGCNDCHTPFRPGARGLEPDTSRLLSGHPESVELPPPPTPRDAQWIWSGNATVTAFAGPWGMSIARNLTPDAETGLGAWSEEQFVRAMRTGTHQGVEGGRPILPPMPWQGLARMTDADLAAVWAYLQSIPAIRNAAPQSIPATASR